jgi:serine/threonine-protein kinase
MAGPQTLGRYKIEQVLGKGAMGVVYQALDPKLHRQVAIKTILISQLDEETAKDFSMRFVREAHAVARLNHPNIVQVYDFGEEGGVAYLVMEFIRGNELKSALATNPVFDRKESVRIMCELLDALDFAHEAGVVHRDIKPANVMLDSQGRTKLADFGVARLTDADRTNAERTQAGTMVGTPAYMSPEQIQGHRVDRRSDIFSAGIILYQFLTGQRPFTGEGAWTIAKKIIQDNPPMPSSINVAVSPEFDKIVAKALAKDPNQRFSTAREFARALRLAAEGKPAIAEAEPTVLAPPLHAPEPRAPEALRSGEMELEFWRSIKDSEDPHDFELYVQQFPQGIYASLAGRRVAKLRGVPGAEDSGTRPVERTVDGTRLHTGVPRPGAQAKAMPGTAEHTRPAVDKTVKLARPPSPAQEPAAMEKKKSAVPVLAIVIALAAAGAGAYFFLIKPSPPAAPPEITAAEKARRETAEKARLAAQAQAQARREAEAQAQRDAELQAKRDAEAKAQREAELKAKAAAELQATRNAAAKAKREAELKTQAAAEARAARDAEAKAKREAEAQAKREAQAQAKREADARVQREADAKTRLASESSLWDSIKASSNTEDFQKYLNLYPNGKNADRARKRLAALEKARLDELRRAEKRKPAIVVPTF